MADEAVIQILGVLLVADPTRNLRSPMRGNMGIFLSTGGGLFGRLRCVMALGAGYFPGLLRVFPPGVAVRAHEIRMGIPKRLLRGCMGRGGKAQGRQTERQRPSVLHGGSNILQVIR